MLLQLGIELCWLVAAVLLTLHFAASLAIPTLGVYSVALLFALLIVILNGAFGLYWHVENLSTGAYALRFILAPAIGIPLAYLLADALPGGESFRRARWRGRLVRAWRAVIRPARDRPSASPHASCRTAYWCSAPEPKRASSRPRWRPSCRRGFNWSGSTG